MIPIWRDSNSSRAVVIAILILIAVNLSTVNLFPVVWGDEIMFVEPAANLAFRGQFVSLAWPFQSDNTLWASNAPLHSLLLAGWLAVFGLPTLTVVRAFGVLEFFCAILFLMAACDRLGLLSGKWSKLLVVFILAMAYGTALNYRSGRYDPTGILLAAMIFFAFSFYERLSYRFLGFGLTLLAVASGLHVAVYYALCLSVVGFWSKRLRRDLVLCAAGSLIFGGILFGIYLIVFDSLDIFKSSASYLRGIPEGALPKDPSLPLVTIAAVMLTIYNKKTGRRLTVVDTVLLSILILTPIVFLLLGRYPTYYSWMVIVPASLLVGEHLPYLLEQERNLIGRWISWVASSLVLIACMFGLPLQLASGFTFSDGRDYARVQSLIDRTPGFSGPVIVDPAAWYAAKSFSSRVYLTTFDRDQKLMTSEERGAIRFAVMSSSQFARWQPYLGGEWKQVDQLAELPEVGFWGMRKGFGDKLIETYSLRMYRRI